MIRTKLTLLAALIGASSAVLAADPQTDAARQQRMDDALQNYRSGTPSADSKSPATTKSSASKSSSSKSKSSASSSSGSTFQRAENSVKSGARKTGDAVERAGNATGEAVERGIESTGNTVSKGMNKGFDAIRRTGETIQEKTGTSATK
jgi:hypothetical protein